jgi:hypothetical protein
MIPGLTTRISEVKLTAAATIAPRGDLVIIAGTTAIATIVPPFAGFGGVLFLVATDAAGVSTLTTGNIALAVSLTTSKVCAFVYSSLNSKWYPGAIS